MTDVGQPEPPWRPVILLYAPAPARAGLAALLALDDVLAAILRTTREPIVGQMRLTWWADALAALDDAPPPAHPVLEALVRDVLPRVSGATLAGQVDGWEALLDTPLDADAMTRFAEARGGGVFAAAGVLLGDISADLGAAGEGWALADLAQHLGDPVQRDLALSLVARHPARSRWPVATRALGALVLLARPGTPGSPRRVGRLLWHRATGL